VAGRIRELTEERKFMEPDNSKPVISGVQAAQHLRLPEDSFFEEYANNVFMEPSVWDLKLIFGKLDQQKGPNVVVQHSSITLPWNYVKAFVYLLSANLLVYEIVNGKVNFPKGVIIPPTPPTEDQEKHIPRSKEAFELAQEMFEKLVADNPEGFELPDKKLP
jgi:hypothetical protein